MSLEQYDFQSLIIPFRKYAQYDATLFTISRYDLLQQLRQM